MADNLEQENILGQSDMDYLKDQIKTWAAVLAPGFVSQYIEAEAVIKKNTFSVILRVNLSKVPEGKAKAARAYEWGSGTHAQRNFVSKYQLGIKGPIRITPKKASFLAFNWEVTRNGEQVDVSALLKGRKRGKPKFASIGNSDGKLLFNYVDHPGVEAANAGKGYMRFSLESNREKIDAIVAKRASDNLRVKVRSVFTRPGGSFKR